MVGSAGGAPFLLLAGVDWLGLGEGEGERKEKLEDGEMELLLGDGDERDEFGSRMEMVTGEGENLGR